MLVVTLQLLYLPHPQKSVVLALMKDCISMKEPASGATVSSFNMYLCKKHELPMLVEWLVSGLINLSASLQRSHMHTSACVKPNRCCLQQV